MFSVSNILSGKKASIKVSFKENSVEFPMSSVISTKGKPAIDTDLQFVLLNAYLDYKGSAYKEQMFNELVKARELVRAREKVADVNTAPYEAVDNIVNMMDFNDIFDYIKNHFKLQPPKHLKTVFEEQIEKDARGSRDQTYLKDDYLELATLATILKAALGPMCYYGDLKNDVILSTSMDYYLFIMFIQDRKLSTYEPMIKLKKFTEKLIEQSDNGSFEDRKRVLERGISQEDLSIFLLGLITFQKLATATLVDDDENKNIVNRIYNYVNSKLKATNSTSKTIRDKEPMADADSASGDKESMPESLRVYEDLAPGMAIEMDWASNTVEKVLSQLPAQIKDKIDMDALNDAKEFTKGFEHIAIAKSNIDFLCYIFKSIMDPRSIEYIKLESIINLIAVGFGYLWGSGFKNLAILLVSAIEETPDGIESINPTINKPRVPKELKEQLDELWPYKKVINKESSVNVAEKAISELCKEYESSNWYTLAPAKYSEGYFIIAPDIKIQFLEFIIANERLIYGK